MRRLPKGWVEARMRDVVEINPAKLRPDYDDRTELVFVPMARVAAEFRGIDVSERRPFSAIKRGYTQFRPGDVLLAKITPCMENGKIAIVPDMQPPLGYGSTEFFVLRPKTDGVSPWIAHCVARSEFRQLARKNMQGAVGQRRVPKTWLKDASVPLAPLPEQHRIIAKIEDLFAKLDEGVTALKRAQANLERYRASVLKAAVEGRLTEHWREQNHPEESGEQLLGRILAERRKRWEEDQLANFAAKGQTPPRNWKKRYKEPVEPDTAKLPELPEGWCWATVDQVTASLRNGRSVRSRPGGFPILRLSAITGGLLNDRETKEGDWEAEDAEPFRVRPSDFFVSRGNGSLDLVGRGSFAGKGTRDVAFPDTMIRVTLASGQLVNVRFVAAVWNSDVVRQQVVACARTSAGIYKVNQLDLLHMHLPVPPPAEQAAIIGLLGISVAVQSDLLDRTRNSVQSAVSLRHSILKRAFEGRLVPQDPNDEPASVLFERVRAERAGAPRSPRRQPSEQNGRARAPTTHTLLRNRS